MSPPSTRAEQRERVRDEILAMLADMGPMTWRELQLSIPVPRAQAWAQAERLLKAHTIVWINGGKRLAIPDA